MKPLLIIKPLLNHNWTITHDQTATLITNHYSTNTQLISHYKTNIKLITGPYLTIIRHYWTINLSPSFIASVFPQLDHTSRHQLVTKAHGQWIQLMHQVPPRCGGQGIKEKVLTTERRIMWPAFPWGPECGTVLVDIVVECGWSCLNND